MKIATFAQAHRLHTAVDDDNTTIVPGKSGQIYEHADRRFGVIFQSDRFRTREAWNNRRRACEAVGMTIHQDGDYEGAMLFDPANSAQAATAIRISGVRPKRQQSPLQLANLTDKYRFRAKGTVETEA